MHFQQGMQQECTANVYYPSILRILIYTGWIYYMFGVDGMRFIFYHFNGDKKNKKNAARFNIERFLFLAFIVTFIIMLAAQAALTNPSIRTFLTAESEFEGTPLGVEEFLYHEGEIGLELISADKNPNLKILVNGDDIEVFTAKVMIIPVKDGDVVEIDGSGIKGNAEVAVISKSDNVLEECIGKRVKVQSNVKRIAKVQVQ